MFSKRLYTGYASIVFVITYLLIHPFYVLFGFRTSWHRYAYKLSFYWAKVFFPLVFIKTVVEIRGEKSPDLPCIVCANHFSYLDIATLPLLPIHACFVGKNSIRNIPFFGYMFRTQHIMVNRNNLRDRAQAVILSMDAIRNNKSLYIFPEGGIKANDPPQQAPYRDGAFRTAIEMQVDIVPVTIAFNWLVLPDDGKFMLRDRHVKLVQHEPICTKGMSVENLQNLKAKVFETINTELELQNNENNRRAF